MKAVFCFKLTFCFMLKLGKEPADDKSVKECSNYIYITRGNLSSKYKPLKIMFIIFKKIKKFIFK